MTRAPRKKLPEPDAETLKDAGRGRLAGVEPWGAKRFHSLKRPLAERLDVEHEARFADLKAATEDFLADYPQDRTRVAALLAAAPPPHNRLEDTDLWSERDDRAETPPEFVQRVLDYDLSGVTRADLKAHPGLYQAYASWVSRNGHDPLNLPTRTTRTTGLLESMDIDQLREAAKLYAAMRMREKRKQG